SSGGNFELRDQLGAELGLRLVRKVLPGAIFLREIALAGRQTQTARRDEQAEDERVHPSRRVALLAVTSSLARAAKSVAGAVGVLGLQALLRAMRLIEHEDPDPGFAAFLLQNEDGQPQTLRPIGRPTRGRQETGDVGSMPGSCGNGMSGLRS